MSIDQYRQIILLYRLRARARRCMGAHGKAGNAAVADIYRHIDVWLEGQMRHAAGKLS